MKYLFPSSIIIILVFTCYYFKSNHGDVQQSKISIELSVEKLNLPKSTKKALMAREFNKSTYSKSMSSMPKTILFHKKLGTDLYNIAMTKAFYSEQKIQILQVAKAHLLYAKNFEEKI